MNASKSGTVEFVHGGSSPRWIKGAYGISGYLPAALIMKLPNRSGGLRSDARVPVRSAGSTEAPVLRTFPTLFSTGQILRASLGHGGLPNADRETSAAQISAHAGA
jgi:hypothetical protein